MEAYYGKFAFNSMSKLMKKNKKFKFARKIHHI